MMIYERTKILKIVTLCGTLLAGCSFGPGNLQSKYSTDLESRRIRRIAVLPPEALPAAQHSAGPLGTPPATEAKSQEREAPEILARHVYLTLTSLTDWQIVSDVEVQQADESAPNISTAARLKRIGDSVFADAVIIGRIQRYRERIGDEWGAKSPASVAFVLDLIDVRRGDIVWSARFDETQKSLSENIFALGDITQRGVRWLSAEQLTHQGVKKAVAQLHQMLMRAPNL
jgi:hypothetical protein